MEDDFDQTRTMRSTIINRIMDDVAKVSVIDEHGALREDADTAMKVYTTALKAISDAEKANVQAIGLKLRQQEQDIASAAAAKDRIMVVLKATEAGRITEDFPSEELESTLTEMFDSDIRESELKSSPRDLESD